MNVQDFSKRWALHYINPDFMKIPMGSSKIFQGSGFFLNFKLRNSPHPDAKWCVVDFYLYSVDKEMYIVPQVIGNNDYFEDYHLKPDSIPNNIKKQIDVENCQGYELMTYVDFYYNTKPTGTEVEVMPTITDALHTVYLKLPEGKYEYLEYTCYGGQLFRQKITLIVNNKLKDVLVNIPHKAMYYQYQLTDDWYTLTGSLDVADKDFKDYLTDPNARIQTSNREVLTEGVAEEDIQAIIDNQSKSGVSGLLNADFYYKQTDVTTSISWKTYYLKVLEKKYDFENKKLEDTYHNYDYTVNPNLYSSFYIKTQNEALEEKISYEYNIAKWRYSGQSLNDQDLTGTGQNFGGAKKSLNQDGTVKEWNIGTLITKHDGPFSSISFNNPEDKYVLEPTLYYQTIDNNTLIERLPVPIGKPEYSYSWNYTPNFAINERNAVMCGDIRINQEYRNYLSSNNINRSNKYISSDVNIRTGAMYRDINSPYYEENLMYPYSVQAKCLPKKIYENMPDMSRFGNSSYHAYCFQTIFDYTQNEGTKIRNNYRYSETNSISHNWYAWCNIPLFVECTYEGTKSRFDNRDVITYTFAPEKIKIGFSYTSGDFDLINDKNDLDTRQEFDLYTDEAYMDSPTIPVSNTSVPYFYIKDSYTARGEHGSSVSIPTSLTLYASDWKAVSLDRIWVHQEWPQGHYFVDYEHSINNGDGTYTTGVGPAYLSATNWDWELEQRGHYYFEVSKEAKLNDDYNGQIRREKIKKSSQDFIYEYTKYLEPKVYEHGLVTYRGRHWSGMVGDTFLRDGWSGDTRQHQMFAVNLTRGNLAESFTVNCSYLTQTNETQRREYLEGEYYWCCFAIIGYINQIYSDYQAKAKQAWDSAHSADSQIVYPEQFAIEETKDSIYFLTIKCGEIQRYDQQTEGHYPGEDSNNDYYYTYVVPYINTPEYYTGHDTTKQKEFNGYMFLGEQLKQKPKFKVTKYSP